MFPYTTNLNKSELYLCVCYGNRLILGLFRLRFSYSKASYLREMAAHLDISQLKGELLNTRRLANKLCGNRSKAIRTIYGPITYGFVFLRERTCQLSARRKDLNKSGQPPE